jgi:O-antigen/teichoic acid export membrane protein
MACVVVLARKLGVSGFGLYGTVMTYLTLFAIFADAGMETITIRDVAQDYDRTTDYFSHVLILRLLLTVGSFAVMLLLGWFLRSEEYPLFFIAGAGLFLFPEAIRKLNLSILSAYERMDLVALLNVVGILFRYTPFLLAIFLGASLYTAFLFFAIAWGCVAGIWMLTVKKYCLPRWFSPIKLPLLKHILYESYPFGILLILSVIYFKADIIMLSRLQGSDCRVV